MVIDLQKAILILIRITSFIVVSPAFSLKGLPNTVKVALSAALSVFTYSTITQFMPADNMFVFFTYSVKEVLIGLAMGYVTNLVFTACEMAGQLIDFQAGFTMATVYDPITGNNVSNYGKAYYWIAIAALFLLDMHHFMINGIVQSFNMIPLGTYIFDGLEIRAIIKIFGAVFETALNFAAPMIIVLLVSDAVLGIISRTVPQINVFMLGMPLKSLLSFVVFLVSISFVLGRSGEIINQIPSYFNGFMNMIGR
ncbi:MAG: flagellar biosynthetic protein FliR [Tissierellales bacterium]|nr:flagellar biosynthetic protein FliR [Tissierellales bacterium]